VELSLTAQPALTGYREALDYLFARTTGGFKFGLERTRELLARLGHPGTLLVGFEGGHRPSLPCGKRTGSTPVD